MRPLSHIRRHRADHSEICVPAIPTTDIAPPVRTEPSGPSVDASVRAYRRAETADPVPAVLDSIDATARTFTDTIIPASAALNCLLDLWSVVHDMDEASAGPVEQLMVGLNRRSYTTPGEIDNAMEMTRILVTASRRSS